jgi:hypothetical protein
MSFLQYLLRFSEAPENISRENKNAVVFRAVYFVAMFWCELCHKQQILRSMVLGK